MRYGYRRVHVLLDREGWGINIKKVYRIYRELGMQLRNKTPKRRVKAKLRDDRTEAVCPNDVWAMDFVHDQLATGKTLRILTVVDPFSRYVPVLDARFSYRGEDVVATLDRVCRRSGYPRTIRVDQGSVFISRDMDLWAYQRGVTLDFSRPGKPTDTPQFADCETETIVNAYDNAVLETDFVLSQAIDMLSSADHVLPALIFLSDHGESLGEGGLYLHAAPRFMAPVEQTKVPMVMWLGEAFQANMALDETCLRDMAQRPLSHDNLFHTVLGLLDIDTVARDPALDITSSCHVMREAS